MHDRFGQPEIKTLAARLSELRPGDPCPCCGYELRSAGGSVRNQSRARPAAPAGVPVGSIGSGCRTVMPVAQPSVLADDLVCPRCGCEVAEVTSPFRCTDHRTICVAA